MAAHTFVGSIDGTFDAGLGVITPSADTPTPAEPLQGAMVLTARATVRPPIPEQPRVSRKAGAMVWLDTPEPVIVKGRPVTPRWHGKTESSGAVLTGAGHFRPFPDPDPVWNGSTWDVPPPDTGGANLIRWTARQLPLPSLFGFNRYFLGNPSTVDGTDTIEADAQQWAASPGSDLGVAWHSAYPFKPTVAPYTHHADDGTTWTEPAAVYFTSRQVEHMWADFGTFLTPPFTFVIMAVITTFKGPADRTYLLDSGGDPTASLSTTLRKDWWKHGIKGARSLDEDYGYRTGLRVQHHDPEIFNDQVPTTRIGKVAFDHTLKPKMFYGVWDGANSQVGNYSTYGKRGRKVHLADHGAQRLAVLGRKNGILSAEFASSMAVFEIRAWDAALTDGQLDRQYAQLVSTWHSHSYH